MSDDRLDRMRKCFQPRQWFFNSNDFDIDPFALNDEVIFMWVYRLIDERYHVGYFMPDKTWFTDSTFEDRDSAAKRVNYLNGGHIQDRGGD